MKHATLTKRLTQMLEGTTRLFMPYFPLGFPNLERSKHAVRLLIENGADAVELGVPFSDPLADGPILQVASQTALEHRVGISEALDFVAELRREGHDLPLFLMGYCNPFLAYGIDRLHTSAWNSGFDALLVPDVPPEHHTLIRPNRESKLVCIPSFVSPLNTEERVDHIVRSAKGFLYTISVAGTTGVHGERDRRLEPFVESLRRKTTLPIAVGFGIKNAEDAHAAAQLADAVIVGSALVQRFAEGNEPFSNFTRELASAIHQS